MTATIANPDTKTEEFDKGHKTWFVPPDSIDSQSCDKEEVEISVPEQEQIDFTIHVVPNPNLLSEPDPASEPLSIPTLPVTSVSFGGHSFAVNGSLSGQKRWVELASTTGSCGQGAQMQTNVSASGEVTVTPDLSVELEKKDIAGAVGLGFGLGLNFDGGISANHSCGQNTCARSKLTVFLAWKHTTYHSTTVSWNDNGVWTNYFPTFVFWPTAETDNTCNETIPGCGEQG